MTIKLPRRMHLRYDDLDTDTVYAATFRVNWFRSEYIKRQQIISGQLVALLKHGDDLWRHSKQSLSDGQPVAFRKINECSALLLYRIMQQSKLMLIAHPSNLINIMTYEDLCDYYAVRYDIRFSV